MGSEKENPYFCRCLLEMFATAENTVYSFVITSTACNNSHLHIIFYFLYLHIILLIPLLIRRLPVIV